MKLQTIPIAIKNTAQNIYKDIITFNLSKTLQDNLELITSEKSKQEYELKKLKREYALYKTKSKGIQTIEEHFFNGEPKLHQSGLTLALRDEIKRLMEIIETQQELIEKKPFVHCELPLIYKPS